MPQSLALSTPRADPVSGGYPMAATSTSTAIVAAELVFSNAERLALAGFLAGTAA
jgi:hypothetical protein